MGIRIDKDPRLVKTELQTGTLLGGIFYTDIENIRKEVPFNESRKHAGRVVDIILDTEDLPLHTILQSNEIKDYTIAHSINVTILAIIAGHALGYSNSDLVKLGAGAVLHDIGKRFISNEIIMKEGPLSDAEMLWIKQHPVLGASFAKELYPELSQEAYECILYHHERLDGSGYPFNLTHLQIPEMARVIAVADIFEAFTAKRPYHEQRPLQSGIDFLRKEDGIDQSIAEKFIKELEDRQQKITDFPDLRALNTKEVAENGRDY